MCRATEEKCRKYHIEYSKYDIESECVHDFSLFFFSHHPMKVVCARVLATNGSQAASQRATIKAHLWLAAAHSTTCHDSRHTISDIRIKFTARIKTSCVNPVSVCITKSRYHSPTVAIQILLSIDSPSSWIPHGFRPFVGHFLIALSDLPNQNGFLIHKLTLNFTKN